MRTRFLSFAAAGLASVALCGVAVAQAPSSVGEVVAINGPDGSVLVARGSETFLLSVGDDLFDNDQVFTRSNGATTLTFTNCTLDLASASSIIVNAEVCAIPPIQLAADDVVGGVTIGAGGAGGIGATPTVLAALVTAGATAVASNDDGPSSP